MLDDEASNSVGIVKQIRRESYNTFLKNSLHNASAPVYDNIQTNSLPMCIQKNSIASSKSKQQLVIIKSDRKTYESVYIFCQFKKGKLNSFFANENHFYPISISKN